MLKYKHMHEYMHACIHMPPVLASVNTRLGVDWYATIQVKDEKFDVYMHVHE
jgi:hypothetical protein